MRLRAIGVAVVVLVFAVMLFDASWRSDDEPRAAVNGREAFDAAKFGRENFSPKVVPALEKGAVDLTELAPVLAKDPGRRRGAVRRPLWQQSLQLRGARRGRGEEG